MTTGTAEQRLPAPRRARGLRFSGVQLMAVGLLVLQLTWVFALPPIGGIDEFDHAYRAAAAARGDWAPTPASATRGTGAWMDVPSDIVDAARPQCQKLPYTKNVDCVGTRHGSETRIASGAGRYFPLFYVVVGTSALPFHGHQAVYVMRVTTIVLCWLLFCAALAAARRWARTPWPLVSVAVASTPVLIFSTTIVSPNGLEMMAGIALWTSLLGLAQTVSQRRDDTLYLVLATVAAAVLVTTRSLGPLWCALIVLTVLLALRPPPDRLRALFGRRATWAAAALVLVCTVLSVSWVLVQHALDIGQKMKPISFASRLNYLLVDLMLWLFQSIAAFPHRDEPSPAALYACYLVIFCAIAVLGWRAADRRVRAAVVVTFLVTDAIPFVLGLNPHSNPTIWQGRYALAYSVGTALLLGYALDRAGWSLSPRLWVPGALLFVTAQTIGPVDVLRQSDRRPLADYHAFPHPWPAAVALTAVVGAALLWYGAARPPSRGHAEQPEPTTHG